MVKRSLSLRVCHREKKQNSLHARDQASGGFAVSTYPGPSSAPAYTAPCANLPAWGCSSSFWRSTPNMFAAGHRLKSLERHHTAHWPSRGMDRDDTREILRFPCCNSGLAYRRTIHSQSVMTRRSSPELPECRELALCRYRARYMWGCPPALPTPTGPQLEFAKADKDSQALQRQAAMM